MSQPTPGAIAPWVLPKVADARMLQADAVATLRASLEGAHQLTCNRSDLTLLEAVPLQPAADAQVEWKR